MLPSELKLITRRTPADTLIRDIQGHSQNSDLAISLNARSSRITIFYRAPNSNRSSILTCKVLRSLDPQLQPDSGHKKLPTLTSHGRIVISYNIEANKDRRHREKAESKCSENKIQIMLQALLLTGLGVYQQIQPQEKRRRHSMEANYLKKLRF